MFGMLPCLGLEVTEMTYYSVIWALFNERKKTSFLYEVAFSQITVQQKVKIVTTLCEVGTCDELWYCKEN